jgi:hypothetical protein
VFGLSKTLSKRREKESSSACSRRARVPTWVKGRCAGSNRFSIINPWSLKIKKIKKIKKKRWRRVEIRMAKKERRGMRRVERTYRNREIRG